MARLEDLTNGTLVKGILPDAAAELVSVKWHGADVLEVVYKDRAGRVGTEILFRHREPSLQTLTTSRPSSFDGEARPYNEVTDYVQEQFKFADRLTSEGRRSHSSPQRSRRTTWTTWTTRPTPKSRTPRTKSLTSPPGSASLPCWLMLPPD